MSKIKVVTDSAGDIPSNLASELNIEIVPLTIRFGTTEYRDVTELSVEDFWAKSATSSELPQTAAPSMESFRQAFETARSQGYDGVVCICLSSKLSATYQAAQKASEAFIDSGFEIRVIDSLLATYGEGSLAVLAARCQNDDLDSIVAKVQDMASRTRVFGALDTLDNLRKGGRLGAAAATLGSILSVKPIIEIANGVVEAHSKQRTRRRALDYLYDLVRQEASLITDIAVIHAFAPDLDEFVSAIKQITGFTGIQVATIGPVIGTHSGPRMIGVCLTTKAN